MIVMKFGGTSVGNGERILNTAKLVKEEPRQKVVVVSALGGVTDKLLNFANSVVNLPTSVVEAEVGKFHDALLEQHVKAAQDAISDKKVRGETVKKLEDLAGKLRVTFLGVGYLEDLSLKSLDYILSFGERLSVVIVAGALNSIGVKSCSLTGYEAGITTDSFFGRARPIHKKLLKDVKAKLMPLLEQGHTPVITGYIAADESACITTLGRGGSDYTASLLGRYLDSEEVQIWTDVDGILSTDPKIVPNARLLSTISYDEAMDLAYFGAKVIHSKMIEPAMVAKIPVRVKNTFNPKIDGTLIVRKQEKVEGIVKAVALAKNVVIVNLQGVGMAETPNIAGRIFSALGSNNINIIMISGSSEANLSFVVSKGSIETAMELIENELKDSGLRDIELIEDTCIITVVGAGMHGAKGIASKIFETVSKEDANIIMIAQGSSEVNIAFMVKEKDAEKVLRALHKRFIENGGKS